LIHLAPWIQSGEYAAKFALHKKNLFDDSSLL
jgi:hypothetical protein